MKAYERLIRYAKIWTTSDEESGTVPSAQREFDLAHLLVEEMKELGIEGARVDDKCYVYGFIPATPGMEDAPVCGFIAHLDTAPDFKGKDVKPMIHENYDGGKVTLPGGIVLDPEVFPHLRELKGRTLITADGTTLLGADDKAGISEIMTAAEQLLHSDKPHGRIAIAFTPDEEIGSGAEDLDLEAFGADFAYTVDGDELGSLEYENFNAANATITFKGRSVHTGDAKGKMINANRVAAEFAAMLPADETPETTEGYQGFYHLLGIQANIEKAQLSYIIRDHDRARFEQRKVFIRECAEKINEKYGAGVCEIEVNDQYYNMKEKIDPNMHVIDLVLKAMQECGVPSKVMPIRGGTDGAQLSFKGLPCPNIFAGGVNFHGPYEFVSIQVMEKAMQVIVKICELTAGYND